MRYIDADALKAGCIYLHKHIDGTLSEMEPVRACTVGQINDAPTIDAVPVKRGKWIGGRFNVRFAGAYEEQCSICGEWSLEYSRGFCSNCGAKMGDT